MHGKGFSTLTLVSMWRVGDTGLESYGLPNGAHYQGDGGMTCSQVEGS
jgi:hypothetical protein